MYAVSSPQSDGLVHCRDEEEEPPLDTEVEVEAEELEESEEAEAGAEEVREEDDGDDPPINLHVSVQFGSSSGTRHTPPITPQAALDTGSRVLHDAGSPDPPVIQWSPKSQSSLV